MRVLNRDDHHTVDDAIRLALYPDPYAYQDQIGKLKAHIDLQSEMIAKLVQVLCSNGNIKAKQLEEILGAGFEVRLD